MAALRPRATRRAELTRAWRDGLPAAWRAALLPLAGAYRLGLAAREAALASGLLRVGRLDCSVVSVGNLTVGGTGKTPLVERLARDLAEGGRRVVILSRGYGGRRPRPANAVALVSRGGGPLLPADRAGDEPVLLARRLPGVPVVVGRDRARAGAWALREFAADVLLLDDGFQQRRLHVDVHVVCLDARTPFGPGGVLPRGSLREPPHALRRAHLLVVTRPGPDGAGEALRSTLGRLAPAAPVVEASYEVEDLEEVATGRRAGLDEVRGRAVLAFAGIGVPDGLVRTLAAHGVVARDLVAFPDHHAYRDSDLRELARRAGAVGADLLVTTEKDAVRLPPRLALPIWALRVHLRLGAGERAWRDTLEARLAAAAAARAGGAA